MLPEFWGVLIGKVEGILSPQVMTAYMCSPSVIGFERLRGCCAEKSVVNFYSSFYITG